MSDISKLTDEELLGIAGGVKSDIEVAFDVIDGKYGNGQQRITTLRAAGYDPAVIQPIVNYILANPARYGLNVNPTGYRDPYLG